MVIATVIRLSLLVMSVKAIYVTNVGLTPVSLAAERRRLHAEVMRIRFVVNAIKTYHRNKIYGIVERAPSTIRAVHHHASVRRQKEPVRPTASRIAWRCGAVRRRQAGSRRSSYHAVASLQSCAKANTAPGVMWRRSHQATMSSSDRKRSIVDQVKPMSRHQSRAGTAK